MSMRSVSNYITLLLALAGCIVTIVLTYEEFHPKADIGCSRMGGDCAKTIQSSYGHVGPVPTSVFGLGMYLTVVGLCLARHKALAARRRAEADRVRSYANAGEDVDPERAYEQAGDRTIELRSAVKRLDGILWGISVLAIGTSFWLQYIALYKLCSFCPWCMASAVIVTLIFLVSTYDFLLEGRNLDGEQKLLVAVSSFIIVCFGFVFAPVVLARISFCGPRYDIPQPRNVGQREIILDGNLKFKGDPKAKYALVEFADYQCPHCKKAAARVDALLKNPPKGGVRFAFRNFPLDQHHWSRPAAMAAEAAGEQGKFWEMHDLIFAHQEEMATPGFARERFDDWAEQLGLNMQRFHKDSLSHEISERIVKDHVAGDVTQMKLTPSFYLVTPTQVIQMTGEDQLEKTWHDPNSPFWK